VSVVLGIGLVALLLAVLAAQFLIFPAMWVAFRDRWRRTPPEHRRRGIVAGILSAVVLIGATAVSIAAPWRETIVCLILVGGGSLALLSLIGVAVQAIRDGRRAKQRRTSA
jgi:hypothetical protein